MEKMKVTAKRLDIFFRVMQVMCIVAVVSALVGLALIASCFMFDLDPEMIGSGYHVMEIGALELEFAEAYAPDEHRVMVISAVEMIMAVAAGLIGHRGIGCVRRILAPVGEGKPFHASIAGELKHLAVLALVLGVLQNVSGLAGHLLTQWCYGLPEVLVGEKIMRAVIEFELDFSFLLISGILLLLSYVFRYGMELQQLSDETL